MPNDRLSRQQERNARGRMRYSSVSDELLPLLQVQKPDQHPDDAGGQKKDAAFYDDAFPDDRQEIVGREKGLRRIFQKERSIRGVLLKISRAMPMTIIRTAVPLPLRVMVENIKARFPKKGPGTLTALTSQWD